jgi:hypothetical protein
MKSPFDISKKANAVNFEWIGTIRDLPVAAVWIQEMQARWPGECVVSSKQTSVQTCGDGSGSSVPSGIVGRQVVYFHFSLPG